MLLCNHILTFSLVTTLTLWEDPTRRFPPGLLAVLKKNLLVVCSEGFFKYPFWKSEWNLHKLKNGLKSWEKKWQWTKKIIMLLLPLFIYNLLVSHIFASFYFKKLMKLAYSNFQCGYSFEKTDAKNVKMRVNFWILFKKKIKWEI